MLKDACRRGLFTPDLNLIFEYMYVFGKLIRKALWDIYHSGYGQVGRDERFGHEGELTYSCMDYERGLCGVINMRG